MSTFERLKNELVNIIIKTPNLLNQLSNLYILLLTDSPIKINPWTVDIGIFIRDDKDRLFLSEADIVSCDRIHMQMENWTIKDLQDAVFAALKLNIYDEIDNKNTPLLSSSASQKIEHWKNNYRRPKEKPSWDIIFLKHAFQWKKYSHDAQTGCGAVITTPDHRIIATGYNGFVRNIDDNILPNIRPEKYPWMIHAEHSAILSCVYMGVSTKDTIIYITGQPCLSCYQYIYQAGIKEIVYGNGATHMQNIDKEYLTNVEIFLWLTRHSLKVRYVDYPK